jgi:hypothetical protein
MKKERHRRNQPSAAEICAMWTSLDVDQSTERLTQQVADTLGISFERVQDVVFNPENWKR